MSQTMDQAYEWDAVVPNEAHEYVTLPAGEYPFEVTGFERGFYDGGKNLPACSKAIVTIKIDGGEKGTATIKENIFLHSITAGIISSFFISIGDIEPDSKEFKMDWEHAVGKTGRAKVKIRTYDKDDETRTINQVDQWLAPVKGTFTPGVF